MATLILTTTSDTKHRYLTYEQHTKTFWKITSCSVTMVLKVTCNFSNYQTILTVNYSYGGNSGSQTVRFSPHQTQQSITVSLSAYSIRNVDNANAYVSAVSDGNGSVSITSKTYTIKFTTTDISAGRIIYASDINELIRLRTAGESLGTISKNSTIHPTVIPRTSTMGSQYAKISATNYNNFLSGTYSV